MKLKIPQFLTQRPAFLTRKPSAPRPPKKLRAATASRRMSPAMDDGFEDEPATRLSSAFFVVLILHVVAVGGIYAFNSIKAHRRGLEPAATKTMAANPQANPEAAAPGAARTGAPEAQAGARSLTTTPEIAPSQAGVMPISNGRIYHVKAGDTLTRIAQQFGCTVAELQMVNNPKDIAVLKPNQVVNLPAVRVAKPLPAAAVAPTASVDNTAKPAAAGSAAGKTYAVQKGDTATSIAKKFNVTVDELLKVNKVSDPKKLQLGQSLKLPVKKVN